MFTAVTWTGDESRFLSVTPNYWTNVVNAYQTADALSQVVNVLPRTGKVTILAHSLGNMLVSKSISDYSLTVDNYFMIDAAVALESFDAAKVTQSTITDMAHPIWLNYLDTGCTWISCADPDKANSRWLWATEWHRLFTDSRSGLTWRNELASVLTRQRVINFYSSTEEVLENADGTVNSLDAVFGDGLLGYKAWSTQEMAKGTDLLAADLADVANWGEDVYGGWGLNVVDYPGDTSIGIDLWPSIKLDVNIHPLTPQNAFQINPADLRAASFFKRFKQNGLYGDNNGSGMTDLIKAEILAHAMPALSYAVGRNDFDEPGIEDVDMSVRMRNGWPLSREDDSLDVIPVPRWKHSDIRDVAYLYVYKLFDYFNEKGELR
jgi:hypothetical protein